MYKSLYPQPRRIGTVLLVLGWLVFVLVGCALVWYGFVVGGKGARPGVTPTTEVTATEPVVVPTLPPSPTFPPPTATSLPTATPLPTQEPTPVPTTPPAVPQIVAGADGVNVRTGPGTSYTRIGYIDPGGQARVIGRYGGWWQIDYNGTPGWVYGALVTASNVENVPEVQPPPAPTAPPAAPAPTATTAPPAPTAPIASSDFRGLIPEGYQVEGAPGPYAVNQNICFNMWITNGSGERFEYDSLGTWVQETGQFQKSYFSNPPAYPYFTPGQKFYHRDCLKISAPGTYHLWLAIHFKDGTPALLKGPVEVIVQ